MKNIIKRSFSFIMFLAIMMTTLGGTGLALAANADETGKITTVTLEESELLNNLMETATQFVVIKAKQHGGSHYAYTEALAEEMQDSTSPDGVETNFYAGSQLILLSLSKSGGKIKETQEVLIDCPNGVLRDADVSEDGKTILFSWKQSASDDYHLYEMTLATREIRQLTFGSGIADFEPQYTANGNIVFSSSRCIQTVDCWKTPVSNLYMCGPDGENIVRLTYDQVHTTFATTTTDGRVIYTRWDYNDRTQMWVQGVFQMNPDGTNQTELWGNNANFPTTLLHTREIPGESDMYISIVSGHHTRQAGKLVTLDLSVGRNSKDAVSYVFPDSNSNKNGSVDNQGQQGPLYKYPYAISKDEFLVSYAKDGWLSGNERGTPFNICLMNTSGEKIVLVEGTEALPASQIVPIKKREMFERASMVNYSSTTGTYYVGNVYEGPSMEGIEVGTVKYLRVVEIVYREYAVGATVASGSGSSDPFTPIATGNGAWDVKAVLGIVPVEADGSVLFKVPALTPVYFQLLDANGDVIQTMRSWTTLMPNETFSCVGCHEDKNTVPPAASNVTLAMQKGVQELQPDFWQDEDFDCYEEEAVGFDYLTEIQTILDKSCVQCHSNPEQTSFSADVKSTVFDEGSEWSYTTTAPASTWASVNFNDASWTKAYAPFGTTSTNPGKPNTIWDGNNIWMRKTFTLNQYQFSECNLQLYMANAGTAEVYINGTLVNTTAASSSYRNIEFTEQMKNACVLGENTIAIKTSKNSGNFIDAAIKVGSSALETVTLIEGKSTWKYLKTATEPIDENWTTVSFDDSSWASAKAPFGDRESYATSWGGNDTFIWLRQTFTIDDISKFKNATLRMNVFFDDNPEFYINGVKVYDPDNWVDKYTDITLPVSATNALKQGTNVFAIKCRNTTGGRYIDTSLEALTGSRGESASVFSLESTNVDGKRTKKYWPLSYLVLTDSYRDGNNIKGRTTNNYTSWISSMSQPEILKPYYAGACNSNVMKKIRSGHGNLSDSEIRAFAAWIDLCVPCYGEYDANNMWGTQDSREAVEESNKRAFYEMLDSYARKARANGGKLDGKDITIYYSSSNAFYKNTATELGMLNVPTKYRVGDKISIVLPEGEKYVWVSLTSKMGESLIYVPNGVYTYEITADIAVNSSYTMNGSNKMAYSNNVITARLATDEELKETRNIAFNSYDIVSATDSYPHAHSNDVHNNQAEFAARNAIDGFVFNEGHGTFPTQSWGPSQNNANAYFAIDFGREVLVSELSLLLRADFPHDDHYVSATVEFSDGSTQEISLRRTSEAQVYDIEDTVTTSIKLKNLEKGGSQWAGFMEVEVYGHETAETIDNRYELVDIESGDAYSLISASDSDTAVTVDGSDALGMEYNGAAEQGFVLIKSGDGYVIKNDTSALTADGDAVTVKEYSVTDANQIWSIERDSDGGYVITAANGKVLTLDGDAIKLASENGRDEQIWLVTPYDNLVSTNFTNLVNGDKASTTADSVHASWGGEHANVIDGDMGTRWQSNATGENADNAGWIIVDLGERVTFNRALVYWETSRASINGYTFEVSNDGEYWVTPEGLSRSRGGDYTDTLDFSPVKAQYLKIYVTAMESDKNKHPSIWEIELYDTNEHKGGSVGTEIEVPEKPAYANLTFDDATGFVTGFAAGETAEDYDGLTIKKGTQTLSGTAAIATGNTATYNGKTYTVVILGDVNGDGKVNSTDFMQVRRHYLKLFTLTGANLEAADVNKDGKVNSTDFMQVRRHFLSLFNLYA